MAASGDRRVCGDLLHPILRLGLVDSLPLHIRRGVWPAALQSDYVVDDVAGAWPCRQMRGWAGLLALEGCPGGLGMTASGAKRTLGRSGNEDRP
jgi:hypothetical protein